MVATRLQQQAMAAVLHQKRRNRMAPEHLQAPTGTRAQGSIVGFTATDADLIGACTIGYACTVSGGVLTPLVSGVIWCQGTAAHGAIVEVLESGDLRVAYGDVSVSPVLHGAEVIVPPGLIPRDGLCRLAWAFLVVPSFIDVQSLNLISNEFELSYPASLGEVAMGVQFVASGSLPGSLSGSSVYWLRQQTAVDVSVHHTLNDAATNTNAINFAGDTGYDPVAEGLQVRSVPQNALMVWLDGRLVGQSIPSGTHLLTWADDTVAGFCSSDPLPVGRYGDAFDGVVDGLLNYFQARVG